MDQSHQLDAHPINRRVKVRIILNMPTPEFKPGFRLSALDSLVLIVGSVTSLYCFLPPANGLVNSWNGFLIAFVIGHFFLFCNVFRIKRALELLWALVFVLLAGCNLIYGQPTLPVLSAATVAVTLLVIGIAFRDPSYHGIFWQRINPDLREWWNENIGER